MEVKKMNRKELDQLAKDLAFEHNAKELEFFHKRLGFWLDKKLSRIKQKIDEAMG
jgi:hypothetical protein